MQPPTPCPLTPAVQLIEPRVPAESATVAAVQLPTDDGVPAVTGPSPSTIGQSALNPPPERPKPRSIAKRKAASMDSSSPPDVSDSVGPSAQTADPQESLFSTRFGRVPKKSKKMIVMSDNDDNIQCSAPDCTVGDANIPMVACSGPACDSQAHICCIGMKAKDVDSTEWFCDHDCRDNSGQRNRKRPRKN
ncbi:hypothetical protein B0H13DRAFT_2017604 [Mycena leptocephala]|nr:hypothetical protein B0H13DRAFT_2017604 [Mycena leptocephala]